MRKMAAFLFLLGGTVLLAQPVPPSKTSTDALGSAGAAAAANREAYIVACRSLASDFGVKLPITITPGGGVSIQPPKEIEIPSPKADVKPKAATLELPEAVQHSRDAVAAILSEDGKAAGSAVLVLPNKLLTTADLGGAKKLRLRFPGGAELPGEVISVDKGVSILSVVQVASGKRESLKFAEGAIGETVYVVASPYGQGETAIKTVINANPIVKDIGRMLKLDHPVHVANSGAALLNEQGRLVGLVCSWPNVPDSYALPIQVTADLLK